MLKTFLKIGLICLLLLFILVLCPVVQAQNPVWLDEFINQNPRWDWSYYAGTGYHRLTTIDGLSAVELGITTQSTSQAYSDSSLHEYGYLHSSGIVDMRLRYQGDDNMGTMGWGTWNNVNQTNIQAAWFFKSNPEGTPTPLQAMVIKHSVIVFQQSLPPVDLSSWQTYRVEFSANGTRFFINGDLVAETSERPDIDQRIELWLDNYLLNSQLLPIGYRTIPQEEKLYFDWVSFSDLTSVTPINCQANANSQNGVNSGDLLLVLANWGKTTDFGSTDLNTDAKVNGLDIGTVINEWGESCL